MCAAAASIYRGRLAEHCRIMKSISCCTFSGPASIMPLSHHPPQTEFWERAGWVITSRGPESRPSRRGGFEYQADPTLGLEREKKKDQSADFMHTLTLQPLLLEKRFLCFMCLKCLTFTMDLQRSHDVSRSFCQCVLTTTRLYAVSGVPRNVRSPTFTSLSCSELRLS